MSQRVNIQYSIDLEELPEEVDRLLAKCNSEINNSLSVLSTICEKNMMSVDWLSAVSDLRLSLAKADHVLDDISKIVTGYLRMAVTPQREMPQHMSPQGEDGPPHEQRVIDPTTIQELQNKLSNFKEMVNNEDTTEVPAG